MCGMWETDTLHTHTTAAAATTHLLQIFGVGLGHDTQQARECRSHVRVAVVGAVSVGEGVEQALHEVDGVGVGKALAHGVRGLQHRFNARVQGVWSGHKTVAPRLSGRVNVQRPEGPRSRSPTAQ